VLREVAATLITTLRREDVAARIGGDEFAAILIGNVGETEKAAERVRAAIVSRMVAHGWPVTASIGAVSFTAVPKDADAALAEADALMYLAKKLGKNQVSHKSI
jgi:diguanylate cyclase (GGDEF)-like protein